MILSLIAAMTSTRVIGKDNTLPWQMPKDLAYFKKMTQNKTVIMGRKTFDSMGKALPNRRNCVITRDKNFSAPNVEVFYSLESLITFLNSEPSMKEQEVFVIGGAQIYKEAMPFANKLYLTFIDANIEGDTHFPEWPLDEWHEISSENHLRDSENPYNYRFVIYERKSSTN